jgi:Concanavalin A-like lectin/glucanases superfamily
MSTSLIVLIPVILLGIVGMLCFVGCTLPVGGLDSPFFEYSDKTVLKNLDVIAYWPLNDKLKATDNPAPAVERKSNIPSSYIDMATAPELYPWPAFPIQSGPDVQSAAAPGASPVQDIVAFDQLGIVPGDAVVPAIPSVIQSCVVVNGCYVQALFDPKFVPQGPFTVEAWVRVGWSKSDPSNPNDPNPDAWRFVLDMRDLDPGRGFGLFAKTEDNQPGVYRWTAMVGNGGASSSSGAGFTILPSSDTITLSSGGTPPKPVYLAMTFDGTTLTLFVNGESKGSMPTTYFPNTAQPVWIGAGAPFVARRSPQLPDGTVGSPLFPFVGAIQDVAIYKAKLEPLDILQHFNNGNGMDPPQG